MLQQKLIAKKMGMTRMFVDGAVRPVTVLSIRVARITGIEQDGMVIAAKSHGFAVSRSKVPVDPALSVGDIYLPAFLTAGAKVDVSGKTKGHGFTGVMQRHGFSGLGAAHGVKKVHRSGGSVGQNTEPGRVHPGTKMAGRHGAKRRTVKNLKVVLVDIQSGLLAVEGAVPGARNGLLSISMAGCV